MTEPLTGLPITRRALLAAAPALAIAGTAAAHEAAQGAGASPAVAQDTGLSMIPTTNEFIDLPLDPWLDAYGRPTAKVMINGQGPFRFMVDTGSTTTVIAQRHVKTFNLPITGTATVNGTTGAALAPLTEIDLLEAGVVRREKIKLAVLPDYGLAREDGILGADVFAGRKLVFKIPEKLVRIEASRRTSHLTPSNIRIRKGLLAEVDGEIGGVRTRLLLDTGAEQCIANMMLSAALKRVYPKLQRVDNVRVIGVTGHSLYGQFIALPKVEARAFSVKDAGAIAADAPIFKVWELEREPAMIVGVNLLSRLESFSIDYGTRRFDAELASMIAHNAMMMG